MPVFIDYADFSVHPVSPQTAVDIQALLNEIRTFEADELGIVNPVICSASGKEELASGILIGITMRLLDPWQLEWYPGDYRATISGGNLTTNRADGNVIKFIVNGPQIEITRAVSATIAETGVSGLTPLESSTLMALPSAAQTAAAVGARVIEGTDTVDDLARMQLAEVAGGATVPPGDGAYSFAAADGSKVRIAGTVANGTRTVTVKDGTL